MRTSRSLSCATYDHHGAFRPVDHTETRAGGLHHPSAWRQLHALCRGQPHPAARRQPIQVAVDIKRETAAKRLRYSPPVRVSVWPTPRRHHGGTSRTITTARSHRLARVPPVLFGRDRAVHARARLQRVPAKAAHLRGELGDPGEATSFRDARSRPRISKLVPPGPEFPARVKCASLCWHTLHAALERARRTVSTE